MIKAAALHVTVDPHRSAGSAVEAAALGGLIGLCFFFFFFFFVFFFFFLFFFAGRRPRARSLACRPTVGSGTVGDSSAPVYGCSAPCKVVASPRSGDWTRVHGPSRGGEVPDARCVVRDEDVGETEVALRALKQVEDLACTDTVGVLEDGRRRRSASGDGERARDTDARALPTGELMREAGVGLRLRPTPSSKLGHGA